jgi:undecaprenyl-diphosphatase
VASCTAREFPLTIIQAILLGVVEGITEYLPVSSTGHLIVLSRALGLAETEASRGAIDQFNIVVQGAAVLAVLGLYRNDVLLLLRAMIAWIGGVGRLPLVSMAGDLRLARNLLLSFLPAAVIGKLFDERIEQLLFGSVPVMCALAVGGAAMLLIAPVVRRRAAESSEVADARPTGASLSALAAVSVGFVQCIAMVPGTSRSMVTIVAALACGMHPREAARYSFLLALPTLGGACVYKGSKMLATGGSIELLGGWVPIGLGLLAAFVSAVLSVRWLVGFLGRGGFALFGWWRIALAVLVGIALLQGWIPR